MKAIKFELPKECEQMELHTFADLHIGDNLCDFKLIQDRINYIANTKNAYCILNGDLMDTAIASSVGDTYGANLQPMEQLKQCVNIFSPIKDKIVAVAPGNHENRIYRQDGLDITALMCHQLGIIDRYTPTTALIFLKLGYSKRHCRKYTYTIYVTHGSGGGRREGGKINRVADLAAIVDADIYIHSHIHLPAVFKTNTFRTAPSLGTVQEVTKLFVSTAASLNYGGYGDTQGFKPASRDNPIIYISGTKKEATALL